MEQRAYKFRIYPKTDEKERLERTLYLCKKLYNTELEQRILAYRVQRKSVKVREQENELPRLKEEMPEYREIYSQVLQNATKRLDKSFDNFFRRNKLRKQGYKIKVGFPRFKSSKQYKSITYPQNANSAFVIMADGNLMLAKIGKIRMFKHREIEGKIKTCTIKKHSDNEWYAIFTVEREEKTKKVPKTAIGIDIGLKQLIKATDGTTIEPPKYLRKSEEQIKHWSREVSYKIKGSGKRKKCIKKLARAYRRVERKRDDYLHKVSRDLVNRADIIVFEDLRIQNMLKNHKLAKSIGDASWGKLIRYTSYKADSAGGSVYYVNPNGTSQICSRCGNWVQKDLSERIHSCPSCGYKSDRDLNASFNILNRYLKKRVGADSLELYNKTPVEMLPLPSPSQDLACNVEEAGSPKGMMSPL